MSVLYNAFGFVLFQIYQLVNNYGIAIILFTLLVKFCILPLNIRQTKSMKEMQALQPELQKLQKKYKNNSAKLNQETTKLYKLYKINPLAGCLPLLLQLPIIYSLFGALRNPQLYVFINGDTTAVSQPFLWIPTLGEADPYYILPIFCVVFTFITQKMMTGAQGGDPQQQKTQKMMLYIMPLFIGWAAMRMPAGVALYWVVQNIFTLVQQYFMLRKPYEPLRPEEAEKRLEEAEREEKKQKKEQRKMQAETREKMAAQQQGRAVPTVKEKTKLSTKPASNKKVVRNTITKIPQREEKQEK